MSDEIKLNNPVGKWIVATCLLMLIIINFWDERGWMTLLLGLSGFILSFLFTYHVIIFPIFSLFRAIILIIDKQIKYTIFIQILRVPIGLFGIFIIGWFTLDKLLPPLVNYLLNSNSFTWSVGWGILIVLIPLLEPTEIVNYKLRFDRIYKKYFV